MWTTRYQLLLHEGVCGAKLKSSGLCTYAQVSSWNLLTIYGNQWVPCRYRFPRMEPGGLPPHRQLTSTSVSSTQHNREENRSATIIAIPYNAFDSRWCLVKWRSWTPWISKMRLTLTAKDSREGTLLSCLSGKLLRGGESHLAITRHPQVGGQWQDLASLLSRWWLLSIWRIASSLGGTARVTSAQFAIAA